MHFHFCQKYECLRAKNVVLHRPSVHFGLGTVSCGNALRRGSRIQKGGFVQEFQERIQIVAGPWANQQAKQNCRQPWGGGGGGGPITPQKNLYPRMALLPSGRNVTSTNTGEAATIRQPEEHPGRLMAICWFPRKGSIPPQFPKCSVFLPKTCKFPPGGPCGPRLRITGLEQTEQTCAPPASLHTLYIPNTIFVIVLKIIVTH